MWFIIIAIIVLIVLIVLCYNSLVATRNKVEEQWSNINVQLERRFDLIPNLVETVRGYTKHEEEILTRLTELRSVWSQTNSVAKKGELNVELTSSLRSIFAVAENYPELKASENFKQLQLELKNTEDKIANSRNSYNSIVNEYNTKIDVIPSNIIANIFHFEKAELFKLEDEEARKNVKVSF